MLPLHKALDKCTFIWRKKSNNLKIVICSGWKGNNKKGKENNDMNMYLAKLVFLTRVRELKTLT